MTCIVGLEHDGNVYVGGDSAGVAGLGLTVRADEKVFTKERRGERWVFGFTTSFRMGQLLRYKLDLPPLPEDDADLLGYLVTDFVEALRRCWKDGGWLAKSEERERGGTFLVGYRGKLFTIEGDLQVARAVDPFYAVGCGADVALGAMTALAESDLSPRAKIVTALDAAMRWSAGVRGPFLVRSTGGESS